ncbi:SPOR domain-containing protein, partial [Candidatus Sumerlaeota bacterium]|nr:SPOR domain-containing protein [Candidatus Sumerlaeota bacterium]
MALNRTAFWGVLAFVAAFSREVRTEELLFSDSFSARQGERPAAWAAVLAPTPRFWYVEENQLASGAGEDLGGSGYSFAVIQAPQSDQWTSCSIGAFFWMRSRTGRAVLVGRWRDENNHYEASVQVSPAGRSGYIDVVREGARKTLNYSVANLGVAIPAIEGGSRDKPHYLQFIMVGPILALYLDGDRLVEATDGSFDRGSAGVGVQHSMVFFDNVRVERARIAGPRSPIPRGAPDGAEGDQIYQLLMNIFASESDARRFQNDLAASGYLNVTVEAVEGRWHVAAGAFQTEAEAERERAYLESQGTRITGVVVRSRGTTQVLPVARRRTPSLPDKVFALRLGRFANLAEADALKRKLETDGVAGPEIRQEGARFAVVAGGFVTRPDAEKWRSSLEARKYKDLEVIEEARNSAPVVVAQAAQPLASATAPTAGISEYY